MLISESPVNKGIKQFSSRFVFFNSSNFVVTSIQRGKGVFVWVCVVCNVSHFVATTIQRVKGVFVWVSVVLNSSHFVVTTIQRGILVVFTFVFAVDYSTHF